MTTKSSRCLQTFALLGPQKISFSSSVFLHQKTKTPIPKTWLWVVHCSLIGKNIFNKTNLLLKNVGFSKYFFWHFLFVMFLSTKYFSLCITFFHVIGFWISRNGLFWKLISVCITFCHVNCWVILKIIFSLSC